MKFSILIPTLIDRLDQFGVPMYHRMRKLADGIEDPVEILMLVDNREQILGEKRQSLVDIAQGEYVIFVDDDDDVEDNFLQAISQVSRESPGVDCIGFHSDFTVDGVVKVPRSEYNGKNPGSHHCAWRRAVVSHIRFGPLAYREDIEWLRMLSIAGLPRTLKMIPEILYHKKYDSKTTSTQWMQKCKEDRRRWEDRIREGRGG
jgi:hypothetical protein